MIITVTMNPVVNRKITVESLQTGCINRAAKTEVSIGGGGIAVSKAVKALGRDSLATGFIGGDNGKCIKSKLNSMFIPHDFVEVRGNVRENIEIEAEGGATTSISGSELCIGERDIERLEEYLDKYLSEDNIIIVTGGIPGNITNERMKSFYKNISKNGVKLIIYTNCEDFENGMAAKPYMLTGSAEELSKYTYVDIKDMPSAIEASNILLKKGAGSVFAAAGLDRTVYCTHDKAYCAMLPELKGISEGGGMTSSVAAFAIALEMKEDEQYTARYAAAASAAERLSEHTAVVTPKRILDVFERTSIYEASSRDINNGSSVF